MDGSAPLGIAVRRETRASTPEYVKTLFQRIQDRLPSFLFWLCFYTWQSMVLPDSCDGLVLLGLEEALRLVKRLTVRLYNQC